MKVIPYASEQRDAIANLFYCAVHAIDSTLYNAEQKAAWAPDPPDYTFWHQHLRSDKTCVATIEGRIAGFMECDATGYMDCAYTHPDYQNRGVAHALYSHIETRAYQQGLQRLQVQASLVAQPFFAHRGFLTVRENRRHLNGVYLTNFLMEKPL